MDAAPFCTRIFLAKGGFFHKKVSQSLGRRFVGFVEPSTGALLRFRTDQGRKPGEEQYAKTNKTAGTADRRAAASALSAEVTGTGVLHRKRAMPWMPVSRPRYCLLAPGWRLSAHGYGRNRKETQMMIQAVLSNPSHPEYGVATILCRLFYASTTRAAA